MRNYIILNGNNSNEITGLLIQSLPPISKPLMRTAIEEIDGRDGDIVTTLGYSAYDKELSIGLYGSYDVDEVIKYFNDNSKGQVTFSNEPDKYYNYEIINQIDFERLIRFKTATVTLHCQPFKYPTEETPVEIAYQYVNNEAEEMDLDNTADAPMEIDLKGNTQQGLPSEYQAVEYIESSGTQYIDTGLKGKNAISIDTDYSITSATTWASLLGCANSTAGNSVACVFGITKSGSINGGWYWRNTTNEQFDSNNVAQLDLKTNLKASATSFVFKNTNGTKTYSFSEVNSFETTPNMYIFASNKNGTINDYSKIKLYYMKIFDGTTLKREYLPCYRISDNVIGLYDMVENKFYTNAGTGTFTKGSNTTLPTPDYPQDIHNVSGDNTIEICGKNRLPITNQDFTIKNVRFKAQSNGHLLINGTASGLIAGSDFTNDNYIPMTLQAGSYTFSRSSVNSNVSVGLVLGNGSTTLCTLGRQSSALSVSFMVNETTTCYLFTYITSGSVVDNYDVSLMVEKGITPTTYEAYTGQSQLISLGVENLIDYTNNALSGFIRTGQVDIASLSGATTYWAKVQPNTNYTMSRDKGNRLIVAGSNTQPSVGGSLGAIIYDGGTSTALTYSFNSGNYQYIALYLSKDSDQTPTKVQLEKGSKANSYSPYGTTPIELCSNADKTIKDGLIYVPSTDKLYKHWEIGEVVYDGTEGWSARAFPDNNYLSVKRTLQVGANGGYCDNFTNNNQYDVVEEHITLSKQWQECAFAILKSRLSTPDATGFKDWLSTHNTKVKYNLATPYDEEIDNDTLKEQVKTLIHNARSYDTSTHITQNANDKPFILNATAIQKGSDTGIVDNDGNIYSKPTLDIEGTGTVAIYLNGNQMFSVDLSNSDECVIDVTNLEAYDPETNELMNRQVTGDYSNFTLPVGENTVKVSGTVTKATITDYTRWL